MSTAPRTASRRAAWPTHLNLHTYQVGFGDCFLLQFVYGPKPADRRHVLIDFGTVATPDKQPAKRMLRIAEDIRARCDGQRLDAVVATHRHADHISGFASASDGKGPGDIIRSLKPRVVLQPWTEDLALATDATGPRSRPGRPGIASARAISALSEMNGLAQQVAQWAARRPRGLSPAMAARLEFLGRDNTRNLAAVENLARMGHEGRSIYASFGVRDPLASVLPGVRTHVLGPPTVEQHPAVQRQRSSDDAEFWHFHARSAATAAALADGAMAPFSGDCTRASGGKLPRETRWAARRISGVLASQALGIVTMLDKAMNNTSLILLLEVGGKRLLFPGDAQIENWSFALGKPQIVDTLSQVDLYKVGHHGSLNATPKSLWSNFTKRGSASRRDRMTSVLSTLPDKHGNASAGTEVPRRTLLHSLVQETHLHSTHEMPGDQLCQILRIDFQPAS